MQIIPKTIPHNVWSIADDALISLLEECESCYLVGSRVTCHPAPTDTDIDILCHVSDLLAFIALAEDQGFERGGYGMLPQDRPMLFISLKRDQFNLIVTTDLDFIDKFILATRVATRMNLLSKPDRVDLFQAILYGKG
jgi:hypothetical protein